jgi:hypothetical protein
MKGGGVDGCGHGEKITELFIIIQWYNTYL